LQRLTGRLIAGIGLGVPGWINQMGLHPRSPLTAMRECVSSVRRLLRGETLDGQGEVFDFHDVSLTYPETGVPTSIHMGVAGPKMLRLSGEIAGGTVLSVAAGHDYVRWAKERIDEGRRSVGRSDPHRITLFAIYSVDGDPRQARKAVRGPLAFYKSLGANALTNVYGISEQLRTLIDAGGYQAVRDGMPDQWIEDLTIAGTPQEVAAKIQSFYDIGVDCVALFPMPSDQVDRMVDLTSEQVLPLLRTRR
jgi:alkanesulfonate monooxygenase SsuD/methylene tetrahydromethanopterin reductase-like flavin-dependent oxidoreductase (luciferase family)